MTDLTVVRGYAIACGDAVDVAFDAYDSAVSRLCEVRDEYDRLQLLRHDESSAVRPSRADLNEANERLCAARVEASLAAQQANAAIGRAERVATFAAQAMAGDVAPALLAEAADAIRALVGLPPEERAA